MLKNKYTLLLTALILFFFGMAGFVLASEVNNPCSNAQDLGTCVTSLFQFGINIAAGLAAVSFVVGAIMYMLSGIDPKLSSSGKDRMLGAILGLLLLAASYAIMSTINENLTKFTITKLTESPLTAPPQPPGVYLYADAGCKGTPNIITTSIDSVGSDVKAYSIVDDSKNTFGVVLHGTDGTQNGGPCALPQLSAVTCQPIGSLTGAMDVFNINNNPVTSGDGVTFYSEPFGPDRGAKDGFVHFLASNITPPELQINPNSWEFIYNGPTTQASYKQLYKMLGSRPKSINLAGDYLVGLYSKGGSGTNAGVMNSASTAINTGTGDGSYISGGGETITNINGVYTFTNNSTASTGTNSSGTYCQTFTDNVTNLNAEPIIASGTGITDIYIIPCTDFNNSGTAGKTTAPTPVDTNDDSNINGNYNITLSPDGTYTWNSPTGSSSKNTNSTGTSESISSDTSGNITTGNGSSK